MPNALLTRLQAQPALIGTFVSINSPALAEALSSSGLDWLCFDWEHAPLAISEIQTMIQAMRPGCLSFIRIPEPEGVYVKKALDSGCDGIIVPQVNSAGIARHVIEAGKYAPLGNRGMGLSRSTGYGYDLTGATRGHNQQKSILVQIEHIQAVENLEAILDVQGIDGIFVGPYDLSSSIGLIGDVQHPQVQAAISRVADIARRRGVPTAIFIGGDDVLEAQMKRGFQLIAVSSDILRLTASARATLALRDQLAKVVQPEIR
jgi:2-keto-3-deoxy-L-rhamnonate aldolase RhmA